MHRNMGEVVSIQHEKLVAPETFGNVAVLMGGWSAEREVSLKSGQAVLKALQNRGVRAMGIDVKRHTLVDELKQGEFDRVFIILHGPGGEDGVVQGYLEMIEMPYTGSGVMASALAMDKLRTKQLLEAVSLPTPRYSILDSDTDFDYICADLGLPLMVKPALEGSSIGMTKVEIETELPPAFEEAAQYDGCVLAEQWITGNEYTVAILGDTALPVIRLETPNTFYDYDAKYIANDTKYHCPCGLAAVEESRLQRLALSAFKTVGATGWGRVDIMTDESQRPYIIEVNTVPGMTDHSLVPMAAKATGIEFDELVYRILMQTLNHSRVRHNRESSHAG